MRRFAFLVICGLGGAAILISLGLWQVQRLAWKEGILAEIETRMTAAPTTLSGTPDAATDEYRPVRVEGVLDPSYLRVLISQKQVGAGYRIIHPLQTQSGQRILIDRGFVGTQTAPAALPDTPVTLTGNLHWPDEVDGFTPAPDTSENIWFARDVPAMAASLGTEPILVVLREASFADDNVTPLPVDTSRIPNDHLQYALTWFSLAAIWLGMTAYFIWRRPRHAEPEQSP